MKLTPVTSSNISAVGYNGKTLTLTVEFHNGGLYEYSPVTKETYVELVEAKSVGSYLSQNIRSNSKVKCNKIN